MWLFLSKVYHNIGMISSGAHEAANERLSMYALVILCVAECNKCEPHLVLLVWQPIRL